MLYLDTSALVKLVRREPESEALADWLTGREQELVSSVLVEVELPRAIRRTGPERLAAVPPLLGRLALAEIDDVVRAAAASYDVAGLRSLDAIHLATAEAMFGPILTAVVSYDLRLLEIVEDRGLPVAHPGRAR
ncbi:MAG: type II toxin-antitoxin system VapC family toxin [Dermatophilaceae bacterium]